jgi:tRNA-dihydrouridine synthase C
VADALRCREVTGCHRIMIGRGMVADPGLAWAIAHHASTGVILAPGQGVAWSRIAGLMRVFWADIALRVASRHRAGRLKQWLNYMRRVYPEAQQAFDALRLVHDAAQIERWLQLQTVTGADS